MSFLRCLRSTRTGAEFDPDALDAPGELRPYELIIDIPRLRRERPNGGWYHPMRQDMWRFGGVLPLDPLDAGDAPHIVTRGEGFTPLLHYDDHPTAASAGFLLDVKDEGRHHPGFGANPTRSFKDRGMAMTVSMARRHGIHKLAIPTQGNAGDALVEYAVSAGLDVAVVAPSSTPDPILRRIKAAAAQHTSVRLELIDGTVREAGLLVRERFEPEGYFNVATFSEPGWRIEGKKTMGYELAESGRRIDSDRGSHEFGGPLDVKRAEWSLPDVVVFPTGGGTGMLGMWKAFDELEDLGVIGSERPRMIAVQSVATAPIVAAFERNAAFVDAIEAGETIAVGLNVPGGVGHDRVLAILHESGGAALSVTDEAMKMQQNRASADRGIGMSPEGAACLAALEPLVEMSLIREGDHVVAFNTAEAGKYGTSLR